VGRVTRGNGPWADEHPVVSAVVLTYQPAGDELCTCLDSLLASDYPALEVLLVDNNSSNGVAAELAAERPAVRFVPLEHNTGFSGGINRGVAESTGSLVFLLNPDAQVEKSTVSLLVDAARRRPGAVGFAPKMLFADDREVIDAVGTAIDVAGAAFNVAIGQLDMGQYDLEEPVMGCCFGAALIRRDAFEPERVGPLDDSFFLYYEDVDWCLRATLLGRDFWSTPEARVYHVHSATSREQAYAFKYRLIQRNLFFTVFKNFERRRMLRIFATRTVWHLRNIVTGQLRGTSVRVLWETWTGVFRYWRPRRAMQRRRLRSDVDAFKLGLGEKASFDPVRYTPIYSWETLLAMVKRMWVTTGEEQWWRAHLYLEAVSQTPSRYRPSEVCERLVEVSGSLPAPLLRFFRELEKQPGMIAGAETAARLPDQRARTA
jgi:GT2 family glycosyltransferase